MHQYTKLLILVYIQNFVVGVFVSSCYNVQIRPQRGKYSNFVLYICATIYLK